MALGAILDGNFGRTFGRHFGTLFWAPRMSCCAEASLCCSDVVSDTIVLCNSAGRIANGTCRNTHVCALYDAKLEFVAARTKGSGQKDRPQQKKTDFQNCNFCTLVFDFQSLQAFFL